MLTIVLDEFSFINLHTSFSGCSVARLSRRVWDAEVAGSNPATPTSIMLRLFNQYSDLYYYSNNDSLYSYSFLKDKINTINSLFSDIIQVYRKEDNAYELKQYIDDMDSFVKENKLQEEEINKYKRHKDIYSILFPEEE